MKNLAKLMSALGAKGKAFEIVHIGKKSFVLINERDFEARSIIERSKRRP